MVSGGIIVLVLSVVNNFVRFSNAVKHIVCFMRFPKTFNMEIINKNRENYFLGKRM